MIKMSKTEHDTERGKITIDDTVEDSSGGIEKFLRNVPGVSAAEDAACGFWMGINWMSTWWYSQNMELIKPIRYAGGTHACKHIAKKYKIEDDRSQSVAEASPIVNAARHAGHIAYIGLTIGAVAAAIDHGPYALLIMPAAWRASRIAVGYTGRILYSPVRAVNWTVKKIKKSD